MSFLRCELSKLVTTIVSTFTANYIHLWPSFFSQHPLSAPLPTFDGRAVLYPSAQNVRDYLSWRQADCKSPVDFLARLWLVNEDVWEGRLDWGGEHRLVVLQADATYQGKVTSTTSTTRHSGHWYKREG